MSENTILLMIVLLFWIKWIVGLMEYHFYLKTLMRNFLFEWWSESSESTKNEKEMKAVVAKTTQLLEQKEETKEKRAKKERKTTQSR